MTLNHATWCVFKKTPQLASTQMRPAGFLSIVMSKKHAGFGMVERRLTNPVYTRVNRMVTVVCKHVKKIEERRASLWVGLVTVNHINKTYFLRKSSLIVLYEL